MEPAQLHKQVLLPSALLWLASEAADLRRSCRRMTAQELVEYYALPFKRAVVQGGAMGIMCSYNAGKMTTLPLSGFTCVSAHLRQCLSLTCTSNTASVNGVPMCANTEMLNGTLRNAWKFDGYVK